MSDATPPGPSSEHNLLYVMMALQMGLVTREALLQALQARVFARDRSLGELLQEQGTLTREQRLTLDLAVNEHLETRGDDAQPGLPAEELPPTVADVMHIPAASDPRANLFAVGSAPAPGGTERMRYRVLRLHARGGLGMVSVARDSELGREVALKELEANGAENEVSRRRFVREAEITGGLEHPGIVPVYGLGRYADGRPYYVMRLIRGETLQEAVESLHAGKAGYTLRDLLTRFLAVCNTVAYAHSRGVIHRDLKPANVMLGPYGETLVVDWGLAKVIGRPGDPSEATEETLQVSGNGGGDHATTREGSALGTPAYMSPEQAGGRVDEQSTATDVYGLGATLYAILTGQAPVEEGAAEEVLEKVRQGDWPAPRHVKSGVPRALDAICHKALALKQEDRYASVLALASDVEHWLAGEPVGAYRDPATARLRRWVRRRKTAVASIAALVMTAAVGLTVGLLAVGQERDRGRVLERQREAILLILRADNQDKEGQYELAVHSYREALAILEQLTNEHSTLENQSLYATSLRGLGSLHHEHHHDAAARSQLQRAVDLSGEVLIAAPEVARYREAYLDNLIRLSETLMALGDHVAAGKMALSAVGAGTDPGEGAYSAARIFSMCIPVAEKDSKLTVDARTGRMDYYARGAMEHLRESIANGFKDAARLRKDPAFNPLRDRRDFKQVLKELEGKPKEGSRVPDAP